MSILWAIIIGFIVGVVAKFLMPGRDPGGFILTTILGIVGALVATFLGQAMGVYAAGQSAGFIGAGCMPSFANCSRTGPSTAASYCGGRTFFVLQPSRSSTLAVVPCVALVHEVGHSFTFVGLCGSS